MKKWLIIANQIDSLNQKVSVLARWAVLVMLALGFWNVIGRYLGVAVGHNLSSNMLIEGQWYLFDLIFLLGLGWTLQQHNHVRVDIFQSRWNKVRKAKIELLGIFLLLLPFSIGVIAVSVGPTLHSWNILESSPDPNGLPRYWMKTLIPLGFVFLSLQGFAEAIRNFAQLKDSSKRSRQYKKNDQENYLD